MAASVTAERLLAYACVVTPVLSAHQWLVIIAAAIGGALAAQTGAPAVPGLLSVPAFSAMAIGPLQGPWRAAGLPKQTLPVTRFDIVEVAGKPVVRVRSDNSYGNLVLEVVPVVPGAQWLLRWSWSLQRGLQDSDLSTEKGDDSPLKVCALFDMPLSGLGLAQRTKLRLARSLSGENLPSATLCYVWDRLLPAGSEIPNAFSDRVRYIVVATGPARPGEWFNYQRTLAADFQLAFGHESAVLPPLLAIAVGADSDNTGGNSLGLVGDISLTP